MHKSLELLVPTDVSERRDRARKILVPNIVAFGLAARPCSCFKPAHNQLTDSSSITETSSCMFRISRTTDYCGKNAGAYRGRECRAAGRRRFQGGTSFGRGWASRGRASARSATAGGPRAGAPTGSAAGTNGRQMGAG